MAVAFLFALATCVSNVHASLVTSDQVTVSTINAPSGAGSIAVSSNVLISNASLVLSGPTGYILVPSSITASSFFGDGSSLTGFAGFNSTQTFSGADSFSSSFTVQSVGRQIILSTSTTVNNIAISSTGVLSFYPELHNSSATIVPAYSTSNDYCSQCVTGSTLTITTMGGRVELAFDGTLHTQLSGVIGLNFMQDGQYVANLSSSSVLVKTSFNETLESGPPVAFRYLIDAPSPGQHSYCLSICNNYPGSGTTVDLLNNANYANLFFVKEIK